MVARHRTQDQGHQGARDKKWGKNPLAKKPDGSASTQPGPEGQAGRSNAIKNKKPQFPLCGELRIAPVSLGPQVGGRGVSRAYPSSLQAGILALGSAYSRRLPGDSLPPVACSRFRSQSQRRDRDGFAPSSLLTHRTYKYLVFIPFCPGCQGKSPGFGGRQRCSGPPPKTGPPGCTWPAAGTRDAGQAGDSAFQNVPCLWPG